MGEQILVPFSGNGSGVAELTWGQQRIWTAMRFGGRSLNMGAAIPLPPDTTIEQLAAMLRFLVSRHQSLRTLWSVDDSGRPQQAVSSEGVVPLTVVDAEDPNEVRKRYQETPFAATEWPVRMAVVRHRDTVTHLIVMYNQLAVDQRSVDILTADVANLDPVTGKEIRPVTALQPLDLARRQGSPAARRACDAALRHWERLLRTVPPQRFGDSTDKRVPRFVEVGYDSPAGHLAAQVIAARTGAGTSAVLLAAFAVALAEVTDNSPVVTQLLVSNRFRPGFADVVGALTQTGLCVLDVPGGTFDELVAQVGRATVSAGKNAYYDLFRRDELVAAVSRDRGVDIDIASYFNDRRRQARRPDGPPPTVEQVRAALPRGAERLISRPTGPTHKLFCHINDVPDTLDVMMRADTNHLSPSDVSACLRGWEAVLVRAALDPDTVPSGSLERAGQ
jgi:Condensation domain